MILTRLNIAILNGGAIYYNAYHTIVGKLDQFIIFIIFGSYYRKGYFNFLKNWMYQISCLTFTFLAFLYLFKFKQPNTFYTSLSFPIEAILWGIVTLCYLYIRLLSFKKVCFCLSYLGMCSFSMYLLHLPIGLMLNKLIGWENPVTVSTSLFQSMIKTIIIVSIFTFNIIEKPFMKLRIKYIKE